MAEERTRIARELHNIVAHAVSVMVLQVGAVRHKLPAALSEDREALQGVEQAGRAALAEMRRPAGTRCVKTGNASRARPGPGLDRLDCAAAGALVAPDSPCGLHVDGDRLRTAPRGIDISAYRIIQEGLTNALRTRAQRLRQKSHSIMPSDQLGIEVSDNGHGAAKSHGRGHGLIGMSVRVKLYNGEMTTTTTNGRRLYPPGALPSLKGQ